VTPTGESPLARAMSALAVSRSDPAAWETLYRHVRPFVLATVYRRLGSVQGLAEDATQEVFLRLLRSCPFEKLRDPDAFRGYVWRVSDNVARTYRRRIMMHAPAGTGDEEQLAVEPGSAGEPDYVQTVELKQLLRKAWRDLNDSEKRLLRLQLDGSSVRETAEALGIAYGTAAVRLMRLRLKLRKSRAFKGMLEAAGTRGSL
jgi:RNA polymerase sigma factor (sigma-70 family)